MGAKRDLTQIIEASPDLVVFGTGFHGAVEISATAKDLLEDMGIEWVAAETPEAVRVFNERREESRVVGAFHLTC